MKWANFEQWVLQRSQNLNSPTGVPFSNTHWFLFSSSAIFKSPITITCFSCSAKIQHPTSKCKKTGLKIWCVLQLVAAGQKTYYYQANSMLLRYNTHAIGGYPHCYYKLLLLCFPFLIIEKIFTSAATTIFRTHIRRRIISIISTISIISI